MTQPFDALNPQLRKQLAVVVAKSETVVRKGGMDNVTRAQQLAAVDTGAMRASVTVTFGDIGGSAWWYEAGPEVFYGIYVELGTWRMRPQPFMSPSFDTTVENVLRAIATYADPLP